MLAEGIAGGFSAIYTELSQLETLGVARRGYFVEGLGGAQFALPGAVERLRAQPNGEERQVVLSAVDPAQPYGAALPWPRRTDVERRPARVAGAYVVLSGGEPIVYLERGGRGLQTLVPADDDRIGSALTALVEHVKGGLDQAPGAREGRRRAGDELGARSGAGGARVPGGTEAADAERLMPEGDTIAYAANRIRPVLVGRVPDEVRTPQPRHALDRWAERLAGRAVTSVDTHGKHLFIRFEGELSLHSHLGMTGAWRVYRGGRALAALAASRLAGAERGGPRGGRVRRPAARAPDRLRAPASTSGWRRSARTCWPPSSTSSGSSGSLRGDDPTRPLGDALLDQRTVAGIGNIWKAEGCWEAAIDPWRAIESVTDRQLHAIIDGVRPRMARSAAQGHTAIEPRVYGRRGQAVPPLRRRDPLPRAGRRQPDDVLVSRLPGLTRSVACRG